MRIIAIEEHFVLPNEEVPPGAQRVIE